MSFREAEITANLAKMKAEMKQWQTRIDTRNMYADKERQKREKILADVSIPVLYLMRKAVMPVLLIILLPELQLTSQTNSTI